MHGISNTDGNRTIDWGRTSEDYSEHRPDYPDRFYELLETHGIGLPNQNILDLGTGVGFLAQAFAKRGAKAIGVDISEGQIASAKQRASESQLSIEYFVAPAEETSLPSNSFDVITASQCWLYFDAARMIQEVRRLLVPGGVLMTSHFCWLPRQDAIAKATEELVLQYNPDWSAADWPGEIPTIPSWAMDDFELQSMFVFDANVPFTYESWRGRIRACRGVGACLPEEEISAFDDALATRLQQLTAEPFTVRHRVDCHILKFKS